MTIASFQTIAIFGATGNLGVPVANSIIAKKDLKVKIFTRKETIEKGDKKDLFAEYTANGAQVLAVDVTNVNDLEAALKGIDVVISVVAGQFLATQKVIIEAAKKAGVKRFYPSEFGVVDVEAKIDHPILDIKRDIRKAVVDAGIELVVVGDFFFLEWQVSPFYSFNFENFTVDITGDGNTKIGFASLQNIAEYVAESINHPLLHFETPKTISPKKGEYYLKIAQEYATPNEIINTYAAATGKKFKPHYIDIQEEKVALKGKNPFETFGNHLRIWQAEGKANIEANFNVESIKASTFKTFFAK
jgi:uncharacterized protein YbjT (DUF2867 family)